MSQSSKAAKATEIFSPPRQVTDISECYFYHVMDIPGYGLVGHEWDLRGGEEAYLGGVSFQGKRVLELGTASGYLCRFMESRGADVIGFDLPLDRYWDIVPFAGLNGAATKVAMRNHIERLKNGWWFTRHLFGSRAAAVYGNIYEIPEELGLVDIATFGSVLLHLRDPFQALYSALRLTRETVVVTEVHPDQSTRSAPRRYVGLRRHLIRALNKTRLIPSVSPTPCMYFLPRRSSGELEPQTGTWWGLPPEVTCSFLNVLGFEDQVVTEHYQTCLGKKVRLYTVVGKRTQGLPTD